MGRGKAKKRIGIVLWIAFIVYLILLIKLIIFKYPLATTQEILQNWSIDAVRNHIENANFIPLKTIRLYLRHRDKIPQISYQNLVYNVFAFIPFGFLVPILKNQKHTFLFTMLMAVCWSAAIECVQLFSLLGVFDVDDIILNTAGAFLGFLIFVLAVKRHGRFLWA